jgi:hypothetical protein
VGAQKSSTRSRPKRKQAERGRPPIDTDSVPVILNAKVRPATKRLFKVQAERNGVNTSEHLRRVVTAYLDDEPTRNAAELYIATTFPLETTTDKAPKVDWP